MQQPFLPTECRLLHDPTFRYTPAAGTDITRTWRRYGWTAPDRNRQNEAKARLNPITEDPTWTNND